MNCEGRGLYYYFEVIQYTNFGFDIHRPHNDFRIISAYINNQVIE